MATLKLQVLNFLVCNQICVAIQPMKKTFLKRKKNLRTKESKTHPFFKNKWHIFKVIQGIANRGDNKSEV